MAKLIDMTLEELYERPKMTKAVLTAIQVKEDFSQRSDKYCNAACILKCNNKESVHLNHTECDVVLLQSHQSPPDRWKSSRQIDRMHSTIIDYLARTCFGSKLRYRVINVLKCDVTPENLPFPKKEHTQTTILKCAPYALEEIKRSKAKLVISLTTAATKAVGLAKMSNYSNRGEVHTSPILDIPVLITLHPKVTTMIRQNASGQMWGPDYFGVLQRDFEKAYRLLSGKLKIPDLADAIEEAKKQIIVTTSISEIKKWISHICNLPKTSVISWDLETSGLDPWADNAKILTTQYGFRDTDGKIKAVVVPLWHRENKMYDPNVAWQYAKRPIEEDVMKVGHNIKFDVKYTRVTTGVIPANIAFDTQLILHDINSGIVGNYGLKRAVWDWIPETGLGGYEDLLEEYMAKVREEEKAREKILEKERKLEEKRKAAAAKKQAQLDLLDMKA